MPMSTTPQPPPTHPLQTIRHIHQSAPRLRLHETPLLRLRVLDLDPPFITEERCQGASVRVRGIGRVGEAMLGGGVDEVERCLARCVVAVGGFEIETEGGGEGGEEGFVDRVAEGAKVGGFGGVGGEAPWIVEGIGDGVVQFHLRGIGEFRGLGEDSRLGGEKGVPGSGEQTDLKRRLILPWREIFL